MAGEFNKSVRPLLAGNYFNWEAEPPVESPPPSVGSVLAIVGTHNSGPFKVTKLVRDLSHFDMVFGRGDTSLRRAVYNGFKGEGRPGRGGAGAILVLREGTAAAAKATVTLQNTTPVNALTLTAKYIGTRGNDLRVTVQPAGTGKELLLILDGLVVERYPFAAADVAELAATINEESGWVDAVSLIDNVALADVAAAALVGGDDGEVLTGVEHTDAQAKLAASRFSVVAPANLTDDVIRTTWVNWTKANNVLGLRHFLVVGGAAGETLTTANARSQEINDWDVVNLGVGTLHDDALNRDFSTAELASRVAGAICNRGEKKDLIYARFTDLSVPEGVNLATLAEQEVALKAGTTVFSQDNNIEAPVFIREGVTTYTDDSASPLDEDGNKTRPYGQYKRIKNLRIQHGIELEIDEWATSGDYLGDRVVNDRVRALILGRVVEAYRRREESEIVQPGWTVELDPTVPVSDDDDFVFYRHGFHPTRSLRQMFHTARVG